MRGWVVTAFLFAAAVAHAAPGDPCLGAAECDASAAFCVDGVCCMSSCAGGALDCQACSVAAGGTVDGSCNLIPASAMVGCRTGLGACDVVEYCNGSSVSCPSDAILPAGTLCRPAVAPCDLAESCSGTSYQCPTDVYVAAGAACSAGACSFPGTCSGGSPSCVDAPMPAGTLCRPPADSCDAAETCTGTSAECPSDAFIADGTLCDDGDPSTTGDMCSDAACVGTPGTSALVVSGTLDFGGVDVQGAPAVLDLIVTSTGEVPLVVDAIVVPAGPFSVSWTSEALPAVLAPGEALTVTVAYLPAAEGDDAADLVIHSSAEDVAVAMTGRGVDRHAEVYPTRVDYLPVTVGNSARQIVEVSNAGEAPLSITSISTTSYFDATPTSATVQEGYVEIEVSFVPPRPGTFTGELIITTDDDDAPTLVVALTGEGVAGEPFELECGCSASGGGGAWWPIVILLALARRRHMSV